MSADAALAPVPDVKECMRCGVEFAVEDKKQRFCGNCSGLDSEAYRVCGSLHKAMKMRDVLVERGVTAPQMAAVGQGIWDIVADKAGVGSPSEVTQTMTIVLLAEEA